MDKDKNTTISIADWDPITITADDLSTITIDTETLYDVNIDWNQDIQLDLDLETLDDKFPVHIANKLRAALEEVDRDVKDDED